jgi:hypothetical protein
MSISAWAFDHFTPACNRPMTLKKGYGRDFVRRYSSASRGFHISVPGGNEKPCGMTPMIVVFAEMPEPAGRPIMCGSPP